MTTLTQQFTDWTGDFWTVTHIYSAEGHFERDGLPAGWHIQLGTVDAVENYAEVDDGTAHDVPESLPDIIIPEPEPEPDEDATVEDYEEALAELGVE